MSSREPLWFCHECGAEAQPLMAPDPVCASCHGSFVEMMDNTNDDPRNFSQADPAEDGFNDAYMSLVARLLESTSRPNSTRDRRDNEPLPRPRVAMSFGGATGTRVFSNVGFPSAEVPTFSDYIRRGPDVDQPGGISGALLGQYMMSMLGMAPGGSGGLNEMFARGFGADSGRMGDYVFNQEALDEVITQLMENNNSHRPVPATEEIMEKLPREVLEIGSPMLQKDCAVCKDQFSLESEDPGEQIVVSLPCKHPFHESCILPWLNSSGTCPVCRHQLIPQPEHHAPGSGDASGSGRPGSPPRRAPNLLQSLFGGRIPDASSSGTQGSSSSRANSNQSPRNSNDHHHVPGGWDGLD